MIGHFVESHRETFDLTKTVPITKHVIKIWGYFFKKGTKPLVRVNDILIFKKVNSEIVDANLKVPVGYI